MVRSLLASLLFIAPSVGAMPRADGPETLGECWEQFDDNMNACAQLPTDPINQMQTCMTGARETFESCINDLDPPDPAPSDQECFDKFVARLKTCRAEYSGCRDLDNTPKNCLKQWTCYAGALAELRWCQGNNNSMASLAISDADGALFSTNDTVLVEFDLVNPDSEDVSDVLVAFVPCDVENPSGADLVTAAKLYALKDGSASAKVTIPKGKLACQPPYTMIVYALDANGAARLADVTSVVPLDP